MGAGATRGSARATWAAGRVVAPNAQSGTQLLAAATLAHSALTLGWTALLARALPSASRSRRALAGAAAGLGIAALDLGMAHALRANPRLAAIAHLRVAPQVADHVAFGAIVGWAL